MKELMIKSNKSLYLFFIDVFFIVLIYYVFYYIINSKMLGMITLIPFFIVVCSNRYTALGILMHDAAHFSFHNSKNMDKDFFLFDSHIPLNLHEQDKEEYPSLQLQ